MRLVHNFTNSVTRLFRCKKVTNMQTLVAKLIHNSPSLRSLQDVDDFVSLILFDLRLSISALTRQFCKNFSHELGNKKTPILGSLIALSGRRDLNSEPHGPGVRNAKIKSRFRRQVIFRRRIYSSINCVTPWRGYKLPPPTARVSSGWAGKVPKLR
jgi:hypothetical protein